MLQPNQDGQVRHSGNHRDLLRAVLADLLLRLEVPHESSSIAQALTDTILEDNVSPDATALSMMRAGSAVGLRIAPVEISTVDVWEVLLDEFPVAVLYRGDNAELSAVVFSHVAGGRVDTTFLSGKTKKTDSLSRKQVGRLLGHAKDVQYFIAEPSLSCEKITSGHDPENVQHANVDSHSDHEHHIEHLSPQKRLLRLLKLDSRDIWTLGVFTIVVSFLDLATPLAVEQMVTTIGFASVIQPLIWIAVLLFAILSLSALIKSLQLFVVEILQRRMIVRVIGDLAERFPRLERSAIDGIHGPEMAKFARPRHPNPSRLASPCALQSLPLGL